MFTTRNEQSETFMRSKDPFLIVDGNDTRLDNGIGAQSFPAYEFHII